MIQLVLYGLLFSAVAINAHPVSKHPALDFAAEARRLVHQANWASVGTISTDDEVKGYPMVTPLSTADSKVGAASSGDIYFYMLSNDMPTLDTNKDNMITFMFSDAQEGECNRRGDDPYSHKCPRTMILGQVKKLEKDSEEYNRGKEAFISRHPTASTWESMTHGSNKFIFCKLDIANVIVFSGYSGYRSVAPQEYFAGTDAKEV